MCKYGPGVVVERDVWSECVAKELLWSRITIRLEFSRGILIFLFPPHGSMLCDGPPSGSQLTILDINCKGTLIWTDPAHHISDLHNALSPSRYALPAHWVNCGCLASHRLKCSSRGGGSSESSFRRPPPSPVIGKKYMGIYIVLGHLWRVTTGLGLRGSTRCSHETLADDD